VRVEIAEIDDWKGVKTGACAEGEAEELEGLPRAVVHPK
jgi:hypothetical protein